MTDRLQKLAHQLEVRPNHPVNEKCEDKDEANNEEYSQELMRTVSLGD